MTILVLADHDNRTLSPLTARLVTAAKALGETVSVIVAGANCEGVAREAAQIDGLHEVLLAQHASLQHADRKSVV